MVGDTTAPQGLDTATARGVWVAAGSQPCAYNATPGAEVYVPTYVGVYISFPCTGLGMQQKKGPRCCSPPPPRKILEDATGVRGKVGKRHFWVTRSNYNIIIKVTGYQNLSAFREGNGRIRTDPCTDPSGSARIQHCETGETEGSGRIHARIRADPIGKT